MVSTTRADTAAALRPELSAAYEALKSITEDQEVANEELLSCKDALQSTNEELETAKEELQSAKEELQSAKEEITTLNEDLRNRNAKLSTFADELSNLLTGVDIPISTLKRVFGQPKNERAINSARARLQSELCWKRLRKRFLQSIPGAGLFESHRRR